MQQQRSSVFWSEAPEAKPTRWVWDDGILGDCVTLSTYLLSLGTTRLIVEVLDKESITYCKRH
jgi:hypothetical protein